MTRDAIRAHCLKMPGATENMQWGDDLVFKVAGKMFAVLNLESADSLAFKCSPEAFAELIEMEGIIPAPYLARAHWVRLTRLDALRSTELKTHLSTSWELVAAKLPKKTRAALAQASK